MSSKYITAIGSINIDEYIKVDSWVECGDKKVAKFIGKQVGGMIANVACNLACEDINTKLINTFAKDVYYDELKEDMLKYNVDISVSKTYDDAITTRCIIVLNGDGERTILIVTEPNRFTLDENQLTTIAKSEYVYSSIVELKRIINIEQFFEAVSESKLVLDIEPDTFETYETDKLYFDKATILFMNHFGFAKLQNLGTDVVGKFSKGEKILVVTKGEDGAEAHSNGKSYFVKGMKVNVLDTTGAGDMFNATFLAGLTKDKEIQEVLSIANEAAAEHVTVLSPKRIKE